MSTRARTYLDWNATAPLHPAAREAMRTHLGAVIDGLLFATEEKAFAEARRVVEERRQRYARATG